MDKIELHWRRVYGLGFAWDTMALCDYDCHWVWRHLHFKIYLGPLLLCGGFRVSKKQPHTADTYAALAR